MLTIHMQSCLHTICILALLACFAALTAANATETKLFPNGHTSKNAPELVLFYSSDIGTSGNLEIFKQVGENGAPIQLTDNSNYENWWQRVSPDGTTVLWYRSPAPGDEGDYANAELWSMNADGGNQTRLIPARPGSPWNWNDQGVVDWKPDGTKLVMAATQASDNRWHIWITNPDGSNPTRISTRTSLYLDPSWSPDGTKIVFSAFPAGYNGTDLSNVEIHVMDADGTNEVRLTNNSLRDHDPYWAPDGSEIAWETQEGPLSWSLRACKPDGSDIRTIINDGAINSVPRWSSDSTQLYFHRIRVFSTDWHIARINADGTNLVAITPSNNGDREVQIELAYLDLAQNMPFANPAVLLSSGAIIAAFGFVTLLRSKGGK